MGNMLTYFLFRILLVNNIFSPTSRFYNFFYPFINNNNNRTGKVHIKIWHRSKFEFVLYTKGMTCQMQLSFLER